MATTISAPEIKVSEVVAEGSVTLAASERSTVNAPSSNPLLLKATGPTVVFHGYMAVAGNYNSAYLTNLGCAFLCNDVVSETFDYTVKEVF